MSLVVYAGPSAELCVAFHALFLFSYQVPKSAGHHGASSAGSPETVTYLDIRTESANSGPILCQRSSRRTSIRRHPAPRAESESVSNCTVRPHCRMAGIGSSAYSMCRKRVESSDRCVRFFTYPFDCCRANVRRIPLLEVCANEAHVDSSVRQGDSLSWMFCIASIERIWFLHAVREMSRILVFVLLHIGP